MDFAVEDAALPPYAEAVNRLLDAKGAAPYRVEDLHGEMNQLKALVDLAHLHGLAVILDLVYNHAGGDFGDESLYFFDRQSTDAGHRNSLYFTEKGHAGGLVFDFGKPEVRDFLIQNGEVLSRRVPCRRLPARPGQRHRSRWRAARLAFLPGSHLDAACASPGLVRQG